MAILSKGTTYAEDDQLTATNLNALVDSATFDTPADATTITLTGGGLLKIVDGGVNTTQLADSGVSTAKIADTAVTTAKLAADCVTAAKIGDDVINSEHYAAGSVDAEHLGTDIVSGLGETTAEPADTDELILSVAGTPKRIDMDDLAKSRFFPQAYGVVTYDGSATLSGAYNLQNPADPADKTVKLEFIADMADANYVVIAQYGDTSDTTAAVTIRSRATGDFTIHSNATKTSGMVLHIAVFGNRA